MKKILSALCLSLCLNLAANEIDTWSSPPDDLSSTGVNSTSPHIVLDDSGNAVAIWIEGTALKSKSKPFGMGWDMTAETLSTSTASTPQLVITPSGDATAIWVDGTAVVTNTKPAGMPWSTNSPTTLDSSGSSPQVAVDTSGNLVAVWVNGSAIKADTNTGMGWTGSPVTLESSDANDPQVAIGEDTNGTVVAVWKLNNTMTNIDNIRASTTPISAISWSTATTVSFISQNGAYPQVAVDNDGNAAAVWFAFEYDAPNNIFSNVILQSSYFNTTSWSAPVDVSAAGTRSPMFLLSTVKFGNDGKAIALWSNSYNGSSFVIESAQTDMNNKWIAPITVASNLYTYPGNLALNAISDAFTAYMADNGMGSLDINTTESHVGGFNSGFWTSPVVLSAGNQNAFAQIAASLSGSGTDCYAAVAWIHNNGTNNIIQSSFGSGTAVVPPSSLMATENNNNFGVFTEYFNLLSWVASTDPNLNGYGIYRNGEIIDFVSGSAMPLEYTDHNREPGGKVRYGITAVDANGTESAIVSYTINP